MNKYYNIVFIAFIIFIIWCSCKKNIVKETLKLLTFETPEQEDIFMKSFDYATEKVCKDKGYGFKDGNCIHLSEKTCLRDHPGEISNEEDQKKLNKYKNSYCKQRAKVFNPVMTSKGEWLKTTPALKKKAENARKHADELQLKADKTKVKSDIENAEKAEVAAVLAERDGVDRCQMGDELFKDWCVNRRLQFNKSTQGVGECKISEAYCEGKVLDYDAEKQDCTMGGDQVFSEFMFGTTVTRGLTSVTHGDIGCSKNPCLDDEFCAGLGNCKKVQDPGGKCWTGRHHECWCDSKCKPAMTPVLIGYMAAAGIMTGPAGLAITMARVAKNLAISDLTTNITKNVGGEDAAVVAGNLAVVRTLTLGPVLGPVMLEAGRCTAGTDGENIPGGENGSDHYIPGNMHGCCAWFQCPPGKYCKGATTHCRDANPPGETCRTGAHSQCVGDSRCRAGITAGSIFTLGGMGICSAGKDGKLEPGKIYKWIDEPVKEEPKTKKEQDKKRLVDDFLNMDEIKYSEHKKKPGTSKPPEIEMTKKRVFVKDNGSGHYIKLGESGCGTELNCPPGYYCPIGAGPCKEPKPPGSHCVVDSWCKGTSECLPSSKCSCGKDAINAPGILYYKNKKGDDVTEGFKFKDENGKLIENPIIYDNGDKHYTCLDTIGCSAFAEAPPGYYCPSAFNNIKPSKNPSSSCLVDSWCKGSSECMMAGIGGLKCSVGEDGVNPPGTLRTHDIPKVGILKYSDLGGNKLEMKVDFRFIEQNTVISKQIGTSDYMALGEKGCSVAYTCPPKAKAPDSNDKISYYCSGLPEACQPSKKPGNYCMMDNWCRSGRCKGSSCSINLDNKWYTPLEGNCSFATDDCEPDTYCDTSGNPGDWLKGKGGECKFGFGTE